MPDDPLKLVIVRDMWLTGFDAPCMHTMYVDKPMKGHGLMQAIARVNRVFRDKPAGLVVDYIGIAQNLKSALGQYAGDGGEQVGIDEAEAVRVLLEKYEIVRAMFRPDTKGGFDYRPALNAAATPQARLAIMAGAIDWVLTLQQADAAKETTEEGKKRAHRRYADAVVALSKAFALAAASDEARAIREEVGFFQAIRAALIKSVPGDGKKSAADRELAIQQIVSRAVVSTEIVDIMKAAGLESPDISILSDEFLAEVRETEKKNLAIEALKKLINGDVRSQSKRNVTQSKAFSERLEAAIARYHANAITTAQVLEELIQLAKDIRAARARGEETGLTRRRNRLLRRAGRERERAAGDGRTRAAGHRTRVGDEHQGQRLGGLDAPGGGPRPDAGAGEAPASQIRLSARLAGCGGAECLATGRGVVGGMGGVIRQAFLRHRLQREPATCRQIRSSRMSAHLPWHCGTCTRNAEAELFQAVASAPRARCSLKQIVARFSPRQAVVATSAAEPLMLIFGRRTTFWRTALAAHTQSIIIFRPIPSATITGGITTLRSFNGYSSSASGCEPKLRRKQQSAKRSAKYSATTNDGAPDAANCLPLRGIDFSAIRLVNDRL